MSGLEKRDFNQILDSLEDNYRHDLAVHLYLTFLSHKVNPHFPGPNWASWPLDKSELPDLARYNRYEDQLDEAFVGDTTPVSPQLKNTDEPRPVTKEMVDDLFSKKQQLSVRCQNSSPVAPNSLLLNELQALVLRKVHQKANLKRREGVDLTTDENNELTQQMALRLAHKLQGLLENLSTAKFSSRKGTWQDVHLQALVYRDHGKPVSIKSERKSYARSKRLFRDVKFNYEYLLDQYHASGEEEIDSDIEFDVNHHLEALDTQMQVKRRRRITPSVELLEKAKQKEDHKEHVFSRLCSEAECALNLSWKKTDLFTKLTSSETHLSGERAEAVTTSTLSALDYIRKA